MHVCVRSEIAERSKKKIEELVGKNNDEINTLLRKYARTYLISIQLGGGQHTHLPGVLYGLQFPGITSATILDQIQDILDKFDNDKRNVLDPETKLDDEHWLKVLVRLNALKKRIGALHKTHGYRYIGITIQKPDPPEPRRRQHEKAETESLVGLAVMLVKRFAGAGAGAGASN